MKRIDFIRQLVLLGGTYKIFFNGQADTMNSRKAFRIRLLRHATLVIEAAGRTVLIDPMLGKKDSMDPVKNAANTLRIPMVELPVGDDELKTLLDKTDAIFVTHIHRDHWDVAAQELIPKDKKIFCQPVDEEKIKSQGFTNVQAVGDSLEWGPLIIHRTNGQHGTGEIGKAMGTVSGFVIQHANETVYIAGDTIWCTDVEKAIHQYHPDRIILNAGAAQFLTGDPITMTADDVIRTARAAASSHIIAVHMETVNHCLLKREQLKEAVDKAVLSSRVQIPLDGEWIIP